MWFQHIPSHWFFVGHEKWHVLTLFDTRNLLVYLQKIGGSVVRRPEEAVQSLHSMHWRRRLERVQRRLLFSTSTDEHIHSRQDWVATWGHKTRLYLWDGCSEENTYYLHTVLHVQRRKSRCTSCILHLENGIKIADWAFDGNRIRNYISCYIVCKTRRFICS